MTTRRERRRAERYQEIVDAAMALVLSDGLSHLTIARLARSCDAAVGAIYRYFPGKADVIAALQLRAVAQLRHYFDQARRDAEPTCAAQPPAEAALRRLLVAPRAWAGFAAEHPALYSLADRSLSVPERLLNDAQAAAVDEAIKPILAAVVGLFDDAVAVGALSPGDAALRAHALWAALHGAGHFRKRDGRVHASLRAAEIQGALVSGLMLGWGASPSHLSAAQEAARR